jgi:transposase
VARESAKHRQVRLMFQDEGRFGLLGDPRRCWAPKGMRPVVRKRQLRQYTYAFSAVSPHDGVIESLVLPWVDTETMSLFLKTVAVRHPSEFIVMVMDQAGWHIAQALKVPKNMQILFLPPYSPELNPAEHLWDDIREKDFANRAFASMNAVEEALVQGLRRLEQNPAMPQGLTGFEWITSISLNAN